MGKWLQVQRGMPPRNDRKQATKRSLIKTSTFRDEKEEQKTRLKSVMNVKSYRGRSGGWVEGRRVFALL
jgi:hypothetical protein